MTVKIIMATSSANSTRRWCSAFESVWPQAQFIPWSEDGDAVDAEYAIVWNPPGDLFQRERGLKAVFNLGAGVDALMKLPGLTKSVQIVRLEDAGMVEQMAEYVVHGLVRVSRQFDVYDTFQRAGTWETLPSIRREDWPVGVMGMGTIGTGVGSAIANLGYPVAGWSRSPRSVPGIQGYCGSDQLPAFLARTRVLVNLLPLTPTTENILNRDTLSRLLPGGYLINVGRGPHLAEDDLLELLDTGHLQGALLDVFREEPLPAGHPFWQHPKVTVTPHIAAITLQHDTVRQIVGKIQNLRQNQSISGVVDPVTGY